MKRLKIGETLSAACPERLLQFKKKFTNKHTVNGDTYYNCGKFLLVVGESLTGKEKFTVVASHELETSVNNFYQLQTAAILSYLLKQKEVDREDVEQLQTNCVGFGNSLLLMLESFEHLSDLASCINYDASGKVRWLVKKHWEKTGKPIEHAWMALESYSLSELCALGIRAADAKILLKNRVGDKKITLKNIYKFVVGNLCDLSGNQNKMSPSKIENSFSETLTTNMENIISVYRFVEDEDRNALKHFQRDSPIFVEILNFLSSNNLNLSTLDFENFVTPPVIKKSLF